MRSGNPSPAKSVLYRAALVAAVMPLASSP